MKTMFKGSKGTGLSLVVTVEGQKVSGFQKRWSNVIFPGKLSRFEASKTICLCNEAVTTSARAKANSPNTSLDLCYESSYINLWQLKIAVVRAIVGEHAE